MYGEPAAGSPPVTAAVVIMKRNMTQTVPRVLLVTFLVALGAFVVHGNSGRWRCYRNLMLIDHALNCNGCVQMGKSEGIIDSDGKWKMDESNWLLDGLNTNRLSCPVYGQKYDVTYVVGTHPQCPKHGNLIRFYGYVPHQLTLRSSFWWVAPTVSFFGAVACGIWTVIAFVMSRRRKAKEDHNKPSHHTA